MKAQASLIVAIIILVSISSFVGVVLYKEQVGPFSTTTTTSTTSSTTTSTSTTLSTTTIATTTTSLTTSTITTTTSTTTTTTIPPEDSPYGVYAMTPISTLNIYRSDPDNLEKQIKNIAQSGAKWVRASISWPAIQPDGPDSWNWEMTDDFLNTIEDYDISIVALVGPTPYWAAEEECRVNNENNWVSCPPGNITDWENFLTEVVNRYGYQEGGKKLVRYWEIRNEPDFNSWLGSTEEYFITLNKSYEIIKSIDPSAKVLIGGLSQLAFENKSTPDFLEDLFSFPNIENKFDIFNFHLYDHWGDLEETMTLAKNILDDHGMDDKPIWITETNPNKPSEEEQAEALSSWYQRFIDAGAERIFYFYVINWCGFDIKFEECDDYVYQRTPTQGGLLKAADHSPTQVYYAYQEMTGVS